MKNRYFAPWIMVAIMAGVAATATARPTCLTADKTFEQEGTDIAWQDPRNWEPDGVPTEDHVVCIPDTEHAKVYEKVCTGGSNPGEMCTNPVNCLDGGTCEADQHVEAKAIVVDGTLEIYPWTTLTISEGSVVDGKLTSWGRGSLLIDSDSNLTIIGDGLIEAYYYEGSCALLQAIIDGAGECSGGDNDGDPCAPCLSTDPCVAGGGTCVPPSPYPTLTLQGFGGLELRGRWETCLPLINNAKVIADEFQNNLIVSADGNTGSGYWIAQYDDISPKGVSVLQIEGSVSGSGTWKIESNAKIVINAACTTLTGDVNLSHSSAKLDVNQNFSTSGNLEMTGGTITVATGKQAAFD